LITTDGLGHVKIWRNYRNNVFEPVWEYKNDIPLMCISSFSTNDSGILAGGDLKGNIWFFDIKRHEVINSIQGHQLLINGISFSADGRFLAAKSHDHLVSLWYWTGHRWKRVGNLYEKPSRFQITGIAFHPRDSQILATLGESDKIVRIWQLDPQVLSKIEIDEERRVYKDSIPNLLIKDKSIAMPKQSDLDRFEFDYFICHASEDKDIFVRPLYNELSKTVRVWYDESTIAIGQSERRAIDHGISHSRFGIPVFSKHFFEKPWTNYELDGLILRHLEDGKFIKPIWLDIDEQYIKKYSPSLAAINGIKTTEYSIPEIAEKLINDLN
jgi:WD40 repeat protein